MVAIVALLGGTVIASMMVEDANTLKIARRVECADLTGLRNGQRVLIAAPRTASGIECLGVSVPVQWSEDPPPSGVVEYEATWRSGALVNARAAR